MNNSIKINDICKSYGKKVILKNVSFEVPAGKVTAFLGPNGAGKSSTLRILLGLDHANSGTATIGEIAYSKIKYPLKTVGASFDGVGSPTDRTVYQHFKIVAASNGIRKTRIYEVARITDISHKLTTQIGKLSLGEGQRLGIAVALLADPQYLILDEPTNGFDPAGICWFREFIKEQASLGKTILISSHILSEVEAFTDEVVFINKGEIILRDSLASVLQNNDSLENVFFRLTGGNIGNE